MKKIGLALSGGGFRASLYHLGLIRFLRDAAILPSVTHITSVSGGSKLAAHLVLNWQRYNGSDSEFQKAASEFLSFIRLDIRNRVIRRTPLAFALSWPRRLLGLSNRRLTRTGLLERDYEKHLYGDASLFELPESPQLHILATNLSEGCLCSFTRKGLLVMRRRRPGYTTRVDLTRASLATVAMAVAASSAFPGFFPPLELAGADVGSDDGEFGRQAFTDGGVFDNLGIRMFHYLEQTLAVEHVELDGVLISDVGKPFAIQAQQRVGGVSGHFRLGIRSSDILMDRVWQLETETFKGAPGFVFARSIDIVEPEEDPTALHPEIQRQLPSIRTDLDRFSPLEISSLARHGYCVARKVCRTRPDLFGSDLPTGPPWEPNPENRSSAPARAVSTDEPSRPATQVTNDARALKRSAVRRIWGTLFDPRDWVSYLYVPILVPILTLLPYLTLQFYERSQRVNQIVESLVQSSRDLEQMTLLMSGAVDPWAGEQAQEILGDTKHANDGFTILQDSRIIDLRRWKPISLGQAESYLYGYRRLKVLKNAGSATENEFAISVLATSPKTQVRFPPQLLTPTLHSRATPALPSGEKRIRWEVHADFTKIPPGKAVDLVYEHMSPGLFVKEGTGMATLAFDVEVETVELSRWLLLPEGKEFHAYRLIRYQTGKPESAEEVDVVTRYLAADYSILAFKLLALKPGFTYELTWYYR